MADLIQYARVPLADRFWAKVAMGDDCWLWTGGTSQGYGQIGAGGVRAPMLSAHRVSWEIHHGPIPKGLHVLHRCDVPACVNPGHLFLGTPADNMADMHAKGRARSGPGGGARSGEGHHGAKLRKSDADYIRSSDVQTKWLALYFNVSASAIVRVRSGKAWK